MRRKNSSFISFFSFQDIIMSVVGIVILITLLLILKLITQMSLAEQMPMPEVSAAELTEQIESLKKIRREIQDELAALYKVQRESSQVSWVPSDDQIDALRTATARIESEIAVTEKSVENAVKHSEELKNRQDAVLLAEKRKQWMALQQQLEQLKEICEKLESEQKELLSQSQDLKKKSEELDDAIEKSSNASKSVEFATDTQASNNYAVVTLYDKNGLTAFIFKESIEKNFSTSEALMDWFFIKQKEFKKENKILNGIFLVVRPSKLKEYESVIETLQSSGLKVGFTLIGENTEFSLKN